MKDGTEIHVIDPYLKIISIMITMFYEFFLRKNKHTY